MSSNPFLSFFESRFIFSSGLSFFSKTRNTRWHPWHEFINMTVWMYLICEDCLSSKTIGNNDVHSWRTSNVKRFKIRLVTQVSKIVMVFTKSSHDHNIPANSTSLTPELDRDPFCNVSQVTNFWLCSYTFGEVAVIQDFQYFPMGRPCWMTCSPTQNSL